MRIASHVLSRHAQHGATILAILLMTVSMTATAAPAGGNPPDGSELLQAYRKAGSLREHSPGLFAGAPGIVVTILQPDAPAAGLGIAVGDVWLRYRGTPIASVQAFLKQRAEPGNEGSLDFLRGRERRQISLPAAKLGVGLVDLAPIDLAANDAGLFFDFLTASFAGEMDTARGLIRRHHDAFERIRSAFAAAGDTDATRRGSNRCRRR